MSSILKDVDSVATPNPLLPGHSLLGRPQSKPIAGLSSPPSVPANTREFGDTDSLRTAIYDRALQAASVIKPVTNTRFSLELGGVQYADPDKISLAEQKKAILEGTSLQRRLRGTWTLKDPQGTVVDSRQATIAHIPHLTQRGTFILGGTEYTLANQMRLRSGIYHRVKENGEIEAHANILPGKGLSHRYFLEPETGVYKIQMAQSSLPLYPILRAMGVTDKELRSHWGNELTAANMAKDDPHVIDKLYARLIRKPDPGASHEQKAQAVTESLQSMEMDPEVTHRTLGRPHAKLTKEAILDSTKKLLAISRGEAETDDRDHLAFQHFMGPEDLLAERLGKDRQLLNQLLWKATYKGHLQNMPAGVFTKSVHAAIMDSGLGQSLEEINPADVFDQQTRVSRLGYGGIPCHSADTEVLTKSGWKLWPEVKDQDELACLLGGKLEFRRPMRLISTPYAGRLLRGTTTQVDYLVTADHRMYVSFATTGAGHVHTRSGWNFRSAADVHGKKVQHLISALPYEGGQEPPAFFTIDPASVEGANTGSARTEPLHIPFLDWIEFLGYYLADGNTTYEPARSEYRVELSKRQSKNPVEWELMQAVLTRLGFTAGYEQDRRFRISGKHLAYYCQQFGLAYKKFIPDYVMTGNLLVRQTFFEALTRMDHAGDRDSDRFMYASTSPVMSEQTGWLALSLGWAVTKHIRHKEGERPQYVLTIRRARTAGVSKQKHGLQYQEVDYTGIVYCAEVPGGLLMTRRNGKAFWSGNSMDAVPDESRNVQPSHLGYVDLLRTPESFKVGVDSRISSVARKGADGKIYTPFKDARTGQTIYKTPQEVADLTMAFPNELEKGKPMVAAMVGGKVRMVPRDKVDIVLPHMEHAFSPITNMVPLKSTIKGQRIAMGSRFITQALPLDKAEAPLVRGQVPGMPGRSFEEHFGRHMGAAFAKASPGRVAKVTPDAITVKYADGTTEDHEIYHNFPYNRKSVTGDTEIIIRRKVDDVFVIRIADYQWQRGDQTLSIDPVSKNSSWMPVTGYTHHDNDKRLFRITTSSGRSVVVTEDHSLMTMGSDGQLVPIYPLDCVINKTRLPVARIPGAGAGLGAEHIPLGQLVGLYLSEGHCPPSQPGLVTIAVMPDDRADEVMALLRKLGHAPYRNGERVCFTDHERCRYLVENFGHLAHNKKIPGWVFHTPIGFRAGLISGYIGGDGCLWEDGNKAIQVTAVSVSKRLRDDVADVLSSMGVFVTFFDAPRAHLNEAWRDGYGLRVISRHLHKLSRWFFYKDREDKFRQLLKAKYRSSSFELVPVPDKKARKLLYESLDEVKPYVYKTAHQGAVAKQAMANARGPFGQWGVSDVMWDMVIDISPVPHQEVVYDLSVAKAEAFAVCHGLIVHNTFLHSIPIVREGDPVQPGQLLAKSNYTDDSGHMALGMNARVAYMPYKGLNYEDAFVVSESMAGRLSSEHMYQHAHEWDERTRKGKSQYVSIFPSTYDKKLLETVDEAGVVKPGTVVRHGDPLILAATERELSHKSVHSAHKGSFADRSVTWDHHSDGVVTDVAHTPKGVTVAVKALSSSQVGDKISGRYGDKGVISAVVPDHEMPHDAQGRPYEVLANPLGVISRCYDEETEFCTFRGWKRGRDILSDDVFLAFDPETRQTRWGRQTASFHSTDYAGKMLHYTASHIDLLVTPNHSMWARSDYPGAAWQHTTAERIAFHRWWVPSVGIDSVPGVETPWVVAELPTYSVKDNTSEKDRIEIPAIDFAAFLGWYLAEGHTVFNESTYEYKTFIAQDERANPAKCEEIAELLSRLPFRWTYKQSTQQFVLYSKRLAAEMKEFGKAHEKYVPQWLFDQPPDVRQAFLDSLWQGDGHCGATQTGQFKTLSSVSERLIDDVQRLWQLQGFAAIKRPIKVKPQHRPMWRCAVMLKKSDRLLGVHGWTEVEYIGKVYCPTVETGFVVTRRNGKPVIAGNTNPGQLIEAALGKIAEKTGKPYTVEDFSMERPDMVEWAMDQLKQHNLPDVEEVTDPTTGRKIPVMTGNRWYMKLHHTSESKGQGRGLGAYTAEEMPARGGEGGSKRLALMDVNALLSHGATEVLRDAKLIRGQKNQEYWASFMGGFRPPSPKVPFIYQKFINQLRASGINVVRQGTQTHIMALTDKDVDHLSEGRELQNTETVDWKTGLKPVAGGLFDVTLTGGHGGQRWAHIKLAEAMPNPVFEEPIRRLLGLTQKEYENVLAGRSKMQGHTGPEGIAKALAAINVDSALAQAREDVSSGRKTLRDSAIRRLGYLKSAQKSGIHPKEWIMSKVPVLPPAFRPVSIMQNTGGQLINDANYLYKELFDANSVLHQAKASLPDVGEERLNVYNAFKAVVGLGDPIQPKSREKKIQGMLGQIFASSPKFGTVQQKLLGTAVDLVGRAVVTPNPDLNMDEVGLPEARAWEVYTPFIVRRLVRKGVPRLQALQYVKDKHGLARTAMLEEMDERPVLVNRAPVLHRYGMLAFKPRLTKGDVLQVSPIVVGGFGMDFDGDASNYQVPASDEARDEAVEKMLPSRNLTAVSSLRSPMYQPRQEYTGGLHTATVSKNLTRKPRVFATTKDALAAYHRGELDPGDPVEILHS